MAEERISTKDILKIIGIGGMVISAAIFPQLPVAIIKTYRQWKNINKYDLGRIIKRLQKQEMISIREDGEKISIEITEKGKRRLLEYNFEYIELKIKKRDGKWRLVIFDIPEDQKKNRDAFRRKLLQLGMKRVQDSVFDSAFPCKDEVDFLCNYLEISDFVTLVSLDKIERGEELIFKRYDFSNAE